MKFTIDTRNSRALQYMAGVGANVGIISTYMHYGWTSPYLPVLQSGTYSFTLSSDEASWFTVVILAGAIIGALLAIIAAQYAGQKFLIVSSSLPLFISWIIIALAESSLLMFVGRFLAGLADGLFFTIVPMYLSEIAEPDIRGKLSSLLPVFSIVGLLLISISGAYLPIDTVSYAATVFPILLFVIFLWMPENPYYLISKGKMDDAMKSLQRLRGTEDVTDELDRITEGIILQDENKVSAFDLIRVGSNRRTLIITLGLRGIQITSGAPIIIFYCQTIFQESETTLSSGVAAIIYFSVQLVLVAVSCSIVDKSGRRPLLIFSTIGCSLAMFVLGSYFYMKIKMGIDISRFGYVPIVALFGFVVVHSVGLQNVPLIMMGEMFAVNVKAQALGLMDIYYGILVTLISKFFHWSNEAYGMYVPFLSFASLCFIGVIFIILFVPETKGKTLEEIQLQLRERTTVVTKIPTE